MPPSPRRSGCRPRTPRPWCECDVESRGAGPQVAAPRRVAAADAALKHGLTLPNTSATIDSDYRGELMIAVINLGIEPVEVQHGIRIAQLVFRRVEAVQLVEVEELPGSERGEGGFGSTGDTL
ncbi:MAG TPA: hypothetical protein VN953_00595 [Gemmatimonadales bacterium]|nr:hypothetical protein [Gemmatimonadales bacterium]